jgi:NhaP-type Na+/H+ or K+/H+ antiporter
MRAVKAGLLYFALVFAAGFVLGPIRILWLVPRVGQRAAELIELPIMLVVIVFAARWIVRRMALSRDWRSRLVMGLVAAGVLLLVELTAVLRLQGMTFAEYFADRDPVAGTAYYLSVLFFALLPLWLSRGEQRSAMPQR